MLLAQLLAVFVVFATAVGLCILYVGAAYSSLKGAPYVPTSNKVVEDILRQAKLTKNMLFWELGAGDGRVVRMAVKAYGVRGVGFEVNPLLVFFARFLAHREGIGERVTFETKDIFSLSFEAPDVLFLFLMPKMLEKLQPVIRKQGKKGLLIISHGFMLHEYDNYLIRTRKAHPFNTYYYQL